MREMKEAVVAYRRLLAVDSRQLDSVRRSDDSLIIFIVEGLSCDRLAEKYKVDMAKIQSEIQKSI